MGADRHESVCESRYLESRNFDVLKTSPKELNAVSKTNSKISLSFFLIRKITQNRRDMWYKDGETLNAKSNVLSKSYNSEFLLYGNYKKKNRIKNN